MRVPLRWLRSYCDPPLGDEELAERLSLSGTKLERLERLGVGSPETFVVGKVLGAERHPDADRLTVCRVDDGSGEPRTIVCGAPNVAPGQTVAVARPGAVLPDGTRLGEVTLRGVTSSGMILAEDEVGISDDHSEIMVLPDGGAPGSPLTEALPILDVVLDVEIHSNRPDCLGVYGVAREVHALTAAPLTEDPAASDAEPVGDERAEDHASVEIADPEICLRFTARVFEDVKIGPSPVWLKQRLTAAGQRPISNVVDITNYVMLVTGQPLHAFDLDEVRGRRIVVRRAQPGERMPTLDGVERQFDPDVALVCDAEGPSGIAGVMGGQISEVSDRTTRVLMEAATWVGPNILRTSAKLGLRTEASTRFEKQLHPDQAMAAQRLAAKLMVELCGARMIPGTLDDYPRAVEPRTVPLRLARVGKLLGADVPRDEVRAILERLGFGVAEEDDVLTASVPSWRHGDVEREVDLIEEVARIHGLDSFAATLPARRRAIGGLNRPQRLRRRIEDALRDTGADEIVAYSLTSPEKLERLGLGGLPELRVANPMSQEQVVMRPLLLPGLLDAAAHNAAHGIPQVALFESAHVYRAGVAAMGNGAGAPGSGSRPEGPARERHHIAALMTRGARGSWRSEPWAADFYTAKGVLEAALSSVKLPFALRGEPSGVTPRGEPAERPFLHPGRSASVLLGDERKAGWIGELHPLVAREWDLASVAAFELDADLIAEEAPEVLRYAEISSFPAVLQDIAVVVSDDVPAAEVEAVVREAGGELLRAVEVFDLYRGEQVGAGAKSLAMRLEFRAPDRTLTDEEVAELRSAIEAALAEIGGRLRA
jgi:phenylalanyl-tRNA synthetase beta chain